MDDQNFDEKTAWEWISAIEKSGKTQRDHDIYPLLNSWITSFSPATLLDIGCGQGICAEKIEDHTLTYMGVDPSPFLIKRAIELYQNEKRNFLEGNTYCLPFLDSSFDGAFSLMVWHLLSDLDQAARELSRILKDQGQFLIVTANPTGYESWKAVYSQVNLQGKKLTGRMDVNGITSEDTLFLHSLDESITILQNAGLRVFEMKTFRLDSQGQEMLLALQGKKIPFSKAEE